MIPAEAIQLCRFVKAACPSQVLDQYTPDAWHLILSHITYADALMAVQYLAGLDLEPGKARYIEPGHIIAQVRRIRTKRIDEYGPIDPPSGISNADYLEWLKTTRNAIASGHGPERPADIENPEGRRRALALVADVTEALPSIESA